MVIIITRISTYCYLILILLVITELSYINSNDSILCVFIILEGFRKWMLQGLGFIVPFLIVGYVSNIITLAFIKPFV